MDNCTNPEYAFWQMKERLPKDMMNLIIDMVIKDRPKGGPRDETRQYIWQTIKTLRYKRHSTSFILNINYPNFYMCYNDHEKLTYKISEIINAKRNEEYEQYLIRITQKFKKNNGHIFIKNKKYKNKIDICFNPNLIREVSSLEYDYHIYFFINMYE